MGEQTRIEEAIAEIEAMIAGNDAVLDSYLAERPYLTTPDEARADLRAILTGLEDVRAGRVFTNGQVRAELDERRRFRTQAAE